DGRGYAPGGSRATFDHRRAGGAGESPNRVSCPFPAIETKKTPVGSTGVLMPRVRRQVVERTAEAAARESERERRAQAPGLLGANAPGGDRAVGLRRNRDQLVADADVADVE